MPKYEMTPEVRAKLAPWHERWLKLALCTDAMTGQDRDISARAIEEMYRLAGKTPPPRERIVFVPSPLVAVNAGGFAAAIWYLRAHPEFAKRFEGAATRAATLDATEAATLAATGAATREATWNATWEATGNATLVATLDATGAATLAAWFLECANSASAMWADGGEWVGYDEWVEFLRFEAGYERDGRVDYAPWEPWTQLTQHSGVRIMHEQFCIISERPAEIHMETVGGRGRLHRLDGPAKSYRDGWSIYAIHGVRVPAQVVLAPQSITLEQIAAESNTEVRRVMISQFGVARYMRETNAQLQHEDEYGKLWRAKRPGDTDLVVLECVNGTPEPIDFQPDPGAAVTWRGSRCHKHYFIRVKPSVTTARGAEAWLHGRADAENYAPSVRT